jgi:hypothetical protein
VAPGLPIHGSTQMSITSGPGAQFAAQRGVARVVVGRELSVREIGKLSQGTGAWRACAPPRSLPPALPSFLSIPWATAGSCTRNASMAAGHALGVRLRAQQWAPIQHPRRPLRPRAGAEIEAFVHGALCVSYSGQCFSSEAWGGRSANRGQCAQACRMPYGLLVDGQLKVGGWRPPGRAPAHASAAWP